MGCLSYYLNELPTTFMCLSNVNNNKLLLKDIQVTGWSKRVIYLLIFI